MFCSRAFAFMALVLSKTRTLCKMHNTQKTYVGNTNKKNLKKTEKSDSTNAQRLFFDFTYPKKLQCGITRSVTLSYLFLSSCL